MKKINPKFNRYIYLGVTLLAVFTGGMLIHYVFSALFGNLSSFRSFFSALNSAFDAGLYRNYHRLSFKPGGKQNGSVSVYSVDGTDHPERKKRYRP